MGHSLNCTEVWGLQCLSPSDTQGLLAITQVVLNPNYVTFWNNSKIQSMEFVSH
jgi:hypothetical protein